MVSVVSSKTGMSAIGHGLSTLHSFCGCLGHGKIAIGGPARGVRPVGKRGILPGFFLRGSVSEYLSLSRVGHAFKDVESKLVIRVLCRAKLQHSRLSDLGSGSISVGRGRLGILNGNGGREVIPFNRSLTKVVSRCVRLHRGRVKLRTRSFFISHGKRPLGPNRVCCVIEGLVNGIDARRGQDPRIIQRAFTAAVLGGNTSVGTVGGVLKRRDLSAARICARTAFDRVRRGCRHTRPQTGGGKNCRSGRSSDSWIQHG